MARRPWARACVAALGIAAVGAWIAAPLATADPSSPAPLIPVKVVFAGSGTLTIDETYLSSDDACTVSTHDPIALSWEATYTTVLDRTGLAGTNGTLAHGPGSFSFSSQSYGPDHCDEVAPIGFPPCAGEIAAGGRAPSLTVSGGATGAPASFQVESVTGLTMTAPGCSPASGTAVLVDLTTLQSALPGALTASGTIPANALQHGGSYTANVSSARAPGQIPANCAGIAPVEGQIGCNTSSSWTGTVTFSPACRKVGEAASSAALPNCLDRQVKEEAAKAAKEYTEAGKREGYNYHVNCTGWALKFTKQEPGGAAFCAGMGAHWAYDTYEAQKNQEIANDPPDPAFQRVAKPRSPRVKRASVLRRALPVTYELIEREARIAGLVGAVTIAQDRAGGAYATLAAGGAGAGAALAKQDGAELSYAKRAASLLGGQGSLARRAATELGRMSSTLHGPHSGRLARAIHEFAASLRSKRARRADARTAAALKRIGA